MANMFEVQTVNPLQALLVGDQAYQGARKNALAEQQKSTLAQLLGGGGAGVGGQPGTAPDFGRAASSLAASGDLDGAVKIATLGKALSPDTAPSVQKYQFAVKNGYKGSLLDFEKDIAQAGSTRVNTTNNVTTGGGGSDKQIFDSVEESAKAARAAATGLTGIREARNALSGGMITGFGANQNLALQKAGAALGIVDPEKIINTETFRSAIAPQVAAMLKSTVGSANISNSDREFAEKAAGGNITLDDKSINRLLGVMERAGSAVVADHTRRLDAIYPNDPKFKRERALFGVNGAASAPAAAPQQPSMPQAAPRRAPDGNLYVPDPNRPGKYLQVVQ